jgi:hypothetical protein
MSFFPGKIFNVIPGNDARMLAPCKSVRLSKQMTGVIVSTSFSAKALAFSTQRGSLMSLDNSLEISGYIWLFLAF